jgi:hypothetical protein
MELPPEDKLRIEEEERYRAEVRAKLRDPGQKSSLPWIIGIGVALIVAAIVWSGTSVTKVWPKSEATNVALVAKPSPIAVPKTRYVPVDQKIATGQIIVKARAAVRYRVIVTPDMTEPTVTGSFNTAGGGGNDIIGAIADEANYINWINGHRAQVFWNTQGRETTGTFEVRLAPGTYYLAFSNKFSAFTNKQVFLEAHLKYKKAETYYDDQPACPVPPCTGRTPYRVKLPGDPP